MFIYKITNTINGKIYIGLDGKNPELNSRWNYHIKTYKNTPKQYKTGCYLYAAMRKYGIENFSYEIIDQSTNTRNELCLLEKKYIAEYNSYFKNGIGYNMTTGGDGFDKTYWEKKKLEPKFMEAWAEQSSKNSKKNWSNPEYRKKQILCLKEAQIKLRDHYSIKSKEQHKNMSIEQKIERKRKISYGNSPIYRFENLTTNEILITNNLAKFVSMLNSTKDTILRYIKENLIFRGIWKCSILYPRKEALNHLGEISWGR
jgi:group I intron endonuclease